MGGNMAAECDNHGQPLHESLNWSLRRDRGTDELIGLCRGVLADGMLVIHEARYVLEWLDRNEPVRVTFAGKHLHDALSAALLDSQMDAEEEDRLVDVLLRLTGGTLPATGETSFSTALPFDDPAPPVVLRGRGFCFTGKFRFGTRKECELCIETGGGFAHKHPIRETSYLVVGTIGSRDWVHSTSGRKIERAVEMREKGNAIRIVSEAHWAQFVQQSGSC
jgi:hypothetical protein